MYVIKFDKMKLYLDIFVQGKYQMEFLIDFDECL